MTKSEHSPIDSLNNADTLFLLCIVNQETAPEFTLNLPHKHKHGESYIVGVEEIPLQEFLLYTRKPQIETEGKSPLKIAHEAAKLLDKKLFLLPVDRTGKHDKVLAAAKFITPKDEFAAVV